MMKTGKRCLVVAIFTQQKSQKNANWTTSWNENAFKVGCVRAGSEEQAFDEGRELLGIEITQAIPLAEIDAGWQYQD